MRFELKAIGADGRVQALELEAFDDAGAAQQAESRGYTVLAVRRQSGLAELLRRRAKFPVVLFSQELLVLLDAGLPLVDSIETLAQKERRPEQRAALERLATEMRQGRPFSAALAQLPHAFPPLYAATVRAAEKTSDLGAALGRYVAYAQQLDAIRKRLLNASIYPLLLVGVGGLVSLFLMLHVVPRFSRIYEERALDLPVFSRALLAWGSLVEGQGSLVLGLLAAAVLAALSALRSPALRACAGDALWRIPGLGERMKLYQLARFYRTIGMLLRGGMPLVAALEMGAELLHPALRERLERARRAISEGCAVSASLEQQALVTPVALRMIAVGEQSGGMGEMMERAAAFHDEEMSRWVDWFTRLFEPLLMTAIGLVIGAIVILMYMPIFELRREPAMSIAQEALAEARATAATTRRRLVDVLEERLGLGPDAYAERLASAVRLPLIRMDELRAGAPAFDLLPFNECAQRGCALVRVPGGKLLLVVDDPFSAELAAWAAERITLPFAWRLAHRGDLVAYLASHEETLRALDEVRASAESAGDARERVENLSLKAIGEERSEVVRLVRSTLRDALMLGASDVHLETLAAGLVIKFRIDGILSQVKSIQDAAQAEQAIARVKVLAELDITERRVPQDGRFKAIERGRAVDFRVSIMPSIHGEDAVLRILDKQALYEASGQKLSLDSLGFDGEDVKALRRLSREPYGMLLVTGPTGSGKTTTLYAAISEINSGQDKIVTIEDPVEYQLPGVLQIPVNEKKGLSFARGLRSILRHDPDKIMVGEIRDAETANIAVQSALTGHLVFTTVHANNVFDVIGRFMHMNVDLYGFVSALNGILAQRLVRLVCRSCQSRGCRECRGAGYKGRKAIAELLVLNDEIRELITGRASLRQLKEAAKRDGTRFLREAALEAVRRGETTLEEIDRVTFAG